MLPIISHAEEEIDYDFQKMVNLIQEVKFIKKADLLVVNLIRPEAINASKDTYELDDTDIHAFYISLEYPKLDVKDESIELIKALLSF